MIRSRMTAGLAATVLLLGIWLVLEQGTPLSVLLWVAAMAAFAFAIADGWRVPEPRRATLIAAVIVATGTALRLYRLTEIPYHVTYDEIVDAFIGIRVARNNPWTTFSGVGTHFGSSNLKHAVQTWPLVFFDPLFGERVASVALGVVSLFGTYFLAARLFGARVALLACTILTFSHWHIWYSRLGYSYMQGAAFVPWALWAAIAGFERRSRLLQFAGGLLLGLTLLLYPTARVAIPVFAGWLLHRVASRTIPLRAILSSVAVLTAGVVLIATPSFRTGGLISVATRYLATSAGPGGPITTLNETGWASDDARDYLADRIARAASIYGAPTGDLAIDDPAGAPLLDPVFLVLSVAGLLYCAWRIRDPGCWLLLCFTGITFVGGQVFTDQPTGAWRAFPLVQALAIAAALVCRRIGRVWLRFVGGSVDRWTYVGVLVVAIAVLAGSLRILRQWAENPRLDPVTMVARYLASDAPASRFVLLALERRFAESSVIRFVSSARTAEGVTSLTDFLESDSLRDSEYTTFLLPPGHEGAAVAIQHCFPGALMEATPLPKASASLHAIRVRTWTAPGKTCPASGLDAGLRARYFSSAEWDGEPLVDRVEIWPLRSGTTVVSGGNQQSFASVEWSGRLRVPIDGSYGFTVLGERSGASLRVGDLTVDAESPASSVSLDAGEVPFRYRCRPLDRDSICAFAWFPPESAAGFIAPQFFRPGAASPPRQSNYWSGG